MEKRKPLIINLILVFILSIIFSNCTLAPCLSDSDLDYVTENPNPEFLVGRYKLDNKTLKYNIFKNSENLELIISSDHTFRINNLPIEGWEFGVFQEKNNIQLNILGKWKTFQGKNGILNKENSIFHTSYNIENNQGDSSAYGGSWKIYEKNGIPVIFYGLGDPDNCEAVRFIKVSE
jgi:hypothetical protein